MQNRLGPGQLVHRPVVHTRGPPGKDRQVPPGRVVWIQCLPAGGGHQVGHAEVGEPKVVDEGHPVHEGRPPDELGILPLLLRGCVLPNLLSLQLHHHRHPLLGQKHLGPPARKSRVPLLQGRRPKNRQIIREHGRLPPGRHRRPQGLGPVGPDALKGQLILHPIVPDVGGGPESGAVAEGGVGEDRLPGDVFVGGEETQHPFGLGEILPLCVAPGVPPGGLVSRRNIVMNIQVTSHQESARLDG
mmetsp:Transcript_61027/g.131672  ORF Transcript_61027/g.131672 Transcript_61027/m.131672 type:complete len:244 (-) Transcript_61027:189-920(-)